MVAVRTHPVVGLTFASKRDEVDSDSFLMAAYVRFVCIEVGEYGVAYITRVCGHGEEIESKMGKGSERLASGMGACSRRRRGWMRTPEFVVQVPVYI